MGSTISGEVSIGPGTVINPMAKILAISGPIVIGENNLIEENAVIINELAPNMYLLYASTHFIFYII